MIISKWRGALCANTWYTQVKQEMKILIKAIQAYAKNEPPPNLLQGFVPQKTIMPKVTLTARPSTVSNKKVSIENKKSLNKSYHAS